MSKSQQFKVSVKNLVEFSCKTGDLSHTGFAGPSAHEGQQAHKKLQSRLEPGQRAEVTLEASVKTADTTLLISGRVDLFQEATDKLILGEIKSCYAPVDKIHESTRDLHWAQLKVYGYCALCANNEKRDTVTLQLIWTNVITDELTVDQQCCKFTELAEFTHKAATHYIEWMRIVKRLNRKTNTSARALEFPHDKFRAGQREMAAAIYVTAREKGTLLCEAPTGIGKTISALFPAVKALGENLIDSAVYLTAKTSGRQSANDALGLLKKQDFFITAITINAKKTTCHCTNGSCDWNSDGRCPLTIGFFDRLPKARIELIQQGIITPDDIDDAATRHQLCPFELTLQLLPWVNLVICDYNYVFDPLVRLSHFTEKAGRKLLLIDECHNLIDRARAMYSAQLDHEQMLRASDAAGTKNTFLCRAFKSVANAVKRVAAMSDHPEFTEPSPPKTVSRAVTKCAEALATTIDSEPLSEAEADAAKEIYRYIVIEELFGDHHRAVSIKQKNNKKYSSLRLQCLNATDKLTHSFGQFRSAAVFSATLRPTYFFRESLGLPQDTPCLSLPSPFLKEQQGTFICNWIDTRYRARQSSIQPLVALAHHVYRARAGNYQIFFPSYVFMEEVYNAFSKQHPDVPIIIQQRHSSDEEKQRYLQSFQIERRLLAFSILGGIYGEGVDYIGDKLIGTIIVGTGLASINLQQKLIEQDFDSRGVNGYDYASKYPGFTRVLQTAGRVIRTESDAGVVVLADKRFNETCYRDMYPDNWQLNRCRDLAELNAGLHDFWAEHFSLTAL